MANLRLANATILFKNLGPDLPGVSGDGDRRSGPCSLWENGPDLILEVAVAELTFNLSH